MTHMGEGWLMDLAVSDYGCGLVWMSKTKEGTNNSERFWHLKVLNINKKMNFFFIMFHSLIRKGKKEKKI